MRTRIGICAACCEYGELLEELCKRCQETKEQHEKIYCEKCNKKMDPISVLNYRVKHQLQAAFTKPEFTPYKDF